MFLYFRLLNAKRGLPSPPPHFPHAYRSIAYEFVYGLRERHPPFSFLRGERRSHSLCHSEKRFFHSLSF